MICLPTHVSDRYTVALTYDAPSTTATIYINGQQTCSNLATSTNPSNIAVAKDFFIGRAFHHNPTLSGELRCFRIYSRALRWVWMTECMPC